MSITNNQRNALNRGRSIAIAKKRSKKHFRVASEILDERKVALTKKERYETIDVADCERFHDLTKMGEDDKMGWAKKRSLDRLRKEYVINQLYAGVCPYCLQERLKGVASWVSVSAKRYRMVQKLHQKDSAWTSAIANDVKLSAPYVCKTCWSRAVAAFRRSGLVSYIDWVKTRFVQLSDQDERIRLLKQVDFCCGKCGVQVQPWNAHRKLVVVNGKVYCRKCK